jgi:hypothetical protein
MHEKYARSIITDNERFSLSLLLLLLLQTFNFEFILHLALFWTQSPTIPIYY